MKSEVPTLKAKEKVGFVIRNQKEGRSARIERNCCTKKKQETEIFWQVGNIKFITLAGVNLLTITIATPFSPISKVCYHNNSEPQNETLEGFGQQLAHDVETELVHISQQWDILESVSRLRKSLQIVMHDSPGDRGQACSSCPYLRRVTCASTQSGE